MQVSDVSKLRFPRGPRVIPVAVLACWAVGMLLFAALPGADGRYVVAKAVYGAAGAFALVCVARAASGVRGRERLFWGLLGAGLIFNLLGDLGWSGLQGSAFAQQGLSYQHGAYAVSYLLFGCAMLILVGLTTKGIVFITALDALGIVLSSGTLIWYLFLDRVVGGTNPGVFATLSWPALDAALIFLGLVVLSTAGRPPFTGLVVAGFLAFLVADGLYLEVRSGNSYGVVGWPDMFWSLGLALLGLAALRAAPMGYEGQRIEPWRLFAFWLGPLSPAVHLGIVLVWGATHPPLPAYAAAVGAALFLYLGLRVALVSSVTRRLTHEQEELARELEGSRVLYELHDTVKGGVHGISLTLRAALEAERRGERGEAREMIGRAFQAARETEFQVSRPYEELRTTVHKEDALPPGEYLRHRLERFEDYFGVTTHEDLQAPLEVLGPAEVAAVNRVLVEAFWNVAKHSGARNMYLETRRVGDLLLVRLRDDGRGFDPSNPPPGMGLSYMRQRAREVGAGLDVISTPGRGTTIQLRFRARRHPSGPGLTAA